MCISCQNKTLIDHSKADAFGDRLIKTLNDGALSLMISVGHRTKLFDWMAKLPPSTVEEIAAAASLNERYVREWLGAMVVGGIVSYDATLGNYWLPHEHAIFLTREHAQSNVAAITQYVPILASVEDKIVDCFYRGGGVPYSAYPRFHEVMAEDGGQSVLPALLDEILPLVPGLSDRLQLGIEVLDVGCGRGLALMLLARHFPRSRFVGIDFSAEAITYANSLCYDEGLANITFAVGDAEELPYVESFDQIFTFDSIHDQAKPLTVLKNINRALRPSGFYLMQDIDASSNVEENTNHPIGALIYTVSCMHCMTVSLARGGAGLGAAWGRELAHQMLYEAGFSNIRIERLPHDFQNCYYVVTK